MSEAIKYLYEKFILRDILSYVTPGALLTWVVLYLFFKEVLNRPQLPWPFYIVLFGIFYAIGFALECLGEILWMRGRREHDNRIAQKFRILVSDDVYNYWWWRAYYNDRKLFQKLSQLDEGYKEQKIQGRERLIVLKQTCGNMCLAVLLSDLMLMSKIIIDKCDSKYWAIFSVGLLLSFIFFWGQRVLVHRLWNRDINYILEKEEQTKKNSRVGGAKRNPPTKSPPPFPRPLRQRKNR